MDPGTTAFPAATELAATELPFTSFLSCTTPEAGFPACRLIAEPAFLATELSDVSCALVTHCEFVQRPCAAASVDANPPARGTELVDTTEFAAGNAETLFEMASRIGITMTASANFWRLAEFTAFGSPQLHVPLRR